jgi:MoxR-like ATPase
MTNVQEFSDRLISNIEQVIVGKRETVEFAVITLLCQGHLLIEDVPGVGKTMLARSVARSIGCSFSRIQFTPDMLPSDVTGVSIFNQVSREFEYRAGPIMAQVVLSDEINRATPKTQAALLEAMEERQVTVDGVTHFLPKPFMVMATQNPIEYEGTFPLPEAQLDRFLLRVKLGYPTAQDEILVLERQQYQHPIETLEQTISEADVLGAQDEVKKVHVAP